MKLTQNLLVKLIEETMDHGGLSCNEVHPSHTHDEWEDHKKEEEKKTKSMAKIAIKPTTKLPAPLQEGIEELYPGSGEGGPFRRAYERTHVDKNKLRDILKNWESEEYESMTDEERWLAYHDDIAELVEESE